MIGKVFGAKARFCNDGCRDSFKTDRECCLIYPPYKFEGDPKLYGVEEASLIGDFCAYCDADLSDDPDKDKQIPRATKYTRKPCPSCEILYINGVRCHETGCPEGP